MDNSTEFMLDEALAQWENSNFSQTNLLPSDREEFKDHILNTIDELKNSGLSDEEAFVIAQMRFGEKPIWGDEMQAQNEDNFQLKKVILLFTGVFAYIFSLYFILCLDKLLMLFLNTVNDNIGVNIGITKNFLYIVFFLTIFSIVALFYRYKPTIAFFNRLRIKPIHIILFVALMLFTVLFEWYLIPQIAISIKNITWRNLFYYHERNFKFVYLLTTGIGYIVLFYRFRRKIYD